MATMGLALPWEAKISSEERERGTRVAAAENPAGGVTPATSGVHPEDLELAAACQAGELHGYERLYSLHGKRMKSIARNLLGTTTDAEDAVQETFLKVQRSIGTFRGQSSFVTWTFRILINTCYDARRSRMRKKEVTNEGTEESPMPEPRAPGSHPSLKLALERALSKLTNHQREVFLLYEVEGFRHAEIAGLLEITETASKNTLFQAKKNLRTMLEPPRSQSAEAR
ncbi:MAG TPA: RNA polymerase sigma factor [Candidatus Dormibacteraeota bacterium]|jgi:RNA polymerase sigma-70 factor (ECF subfamily)|nr:RNA polymerase sigma factor [Candidatus Dormibacteraeota bacterium]